MLDISTKTNLLEENEYRYSLQDVAEPNLYRTYFSYDEVPKVAFNHRRVPMNMPEEIWINENHKASCWMNIKDILSSAGNNVEAGALGCEGGEV